MAVQLNWVSHITSELTRRREFNQASPDESSCETRYRRSRPTICSMPPPNLEFQTINNFTWLRSHNVGRSRPIVGRDNHMSVDSKAGVYTLASDACERAKHSRK